MKCVYAHASVLGQHILRVVSCVYWYCMKCVPASVNTALYVSNVTQSKVPKAMARSLETLSSRKSSSSTTNLEVPVLGLTKSLKIFENKFCRHSMIITITMHVNRDEWAKELFCYEKKEFADLPDLLEKIIQQPQHQWNAYSTQVIHVGLATLWCAGMGN